MYQLKLITSRLKKEKISYFMTSIQIFIGILIVGFTLNIYIDINKEYDEFFKSQKDKEYLITHNELDKPSIAITEETLSNILNITTNSDIFANYEFNFITFAGTVRKVDGENIVDTYKIQYTNEVDEVYASENFKQTLLSSNVENSSNFEELPFVFKNDTIIFEDGESLKVNTYDDIQENVHIMKIPIKYFYEYQKNIQDMKYYIKVKVNTDNLTEINNLLLNIEKILNNNSKYKFIINSEYFDFMDRAMDLEERATLYMFFSLVLMITVFIGLSALFILLVEKRSFEISVSLTLGAKVKDIITQFIIEFAIISILPTILALIILKVFINSKNILGVYIEKISTITCIYILLGVIVTIIIFLLPVIWKLYKLKPYEFIKES